MLNYFNPNDQQKYRLSPYKNGRIEIYTKEDEQFLPFPENPFYLISNYGRVYDCVHEIKLEGYYDKDGYHRFKLAIGPNKGEYYGHQLVGLTFLAYQNHPPFINHKNEIKWDNKVSNLEWVTNQENVQYSFDTGSVSGKKGRAHTYYTVDQKQYICFLIQNGYSAKQIAEKLGIECNTNFVKLISKIRTGTRWNNISYNYTFPSAQESENDIKIICKYIEQGLSTTQIAELTNRINDSNFSTLISDLRSGKRWKNITKDYNIFPVMRPKEQVDEICYHIKLGKDNKEIANLLNLEYTKSFVVFMSLLRHKRIFKDISSKYF